MKTLTKEQIDFINNTYQRVLSGGIPVGLVMGGVENNAIAYSPVAFKKASLEIAKFLDAIHVTYSVFGGEDIILTEDVELDYFDSNLKETTKEYKANQIMKHAEKMNKNIVVFQVNGLFNYNINIY